MNVWEKVWVTERRILPLASRRRELPKSRPHFMRKSFEGRVAFLVSSTAFSEDLTLIHFITSL